MKIKKLNARGFSHDIVIVGFLLIFAIIGVGMLVGSHAAAGSNPNNCKIQPGLITPVAGKLAQINGYFANTTITGKTFKDHVFTLNRNDAGMAAFGYCWVSGEGMAYSSPVVVNGVQTVPMNEYWSPNILKHFYTVQPSNVEPAGCCGYSYQDVAFYVFPNGSVPGTTPLYRFYSPITNGHTYTIDGSQHTRDVLTTNFGYRYEGIVGWVWPNNTSVNGTNSPTGTGNGGVPTTKVPVQAPAPAPAPSKPTTPPPSGGAPVTGGKTGSGTSGSSSGSGKPSGSSTGGSSVTGTKTGSGGSSKPVTPKPTSPSTDGKAGNGGNLVKNPPTNWGSLGKQKPDVPITCKIPLADRLSGTCKTKTSPKTDIGVTQPKNVPPATGPNPVPFYKVKGTRVYNAKTGKEFIPYGISIIDSLEQPNWSSPAYEQVTDAQIVASARYWHSNAIRLQVAESNIVGNSAAMQRLGQEVDEIEALGKVPIINDNVEFTHADQYGPTGKTIEFWDEVSSFLAKRDANKYKNVIFDVFNEPRPTGDVWVNGGSYSFRGNSGNYVGEQDLVNAIRQGPTVLSSNLIWVESQRDDSGWSGLDSMHVAGDNIVYSYHHVDLDKIYDSKGHLQNKDLLLSDLGMKSKYNVAVVDGEWAQYESSRPECHDNGAVATDDYLRQLQGYHVGLIFWSLEPGVGTTMDNVVGASNQKQLTDTIDSEFPLTAAAYSKPNHFPSDPGSYKCTDKAVKFTKSNGDIGTRDYLTVGHGAGNEIMQYFSQNADKYDGK